MLNDKYLLLIGRTLEVLLQALIEIGAPLTMPHIGGLACEKEQIYLLLSCRTLKNYLLKPTLLQKELEHLIGY